MLAASAQLLRALSWSYFFLTLLGAGAAYIQNNVFLGVNSDKVSTLKGQMARWKRTTTREWMKNYNRHQDSFIAYIWNLQ